MSEDMSNENYPEKKCVHCVIKGRVQGVFYRATAENQAQSLGLTGWVRNLSDGDVELKACGLNQDVDAFCEWLKNGPPMADVGSVDVQEIPEENFDGFRIIED